MSCLVPGGRIDNGIKVNCRHIDLAVFLQDDFLRHLPDSDSPGAADMAECGDMNAGIAMQQANSRIHFQNRITASDPGPHPLPPDRMPSILAGWFRRSIRKRREIQRRMAAILGKLAEKPAIFTRTLQVLRRIVERQRHTCPIDPVRALIAG